jgi:NAD-dependent SIR2 family protein deacetylase
MWFVEVEYPEAVVEAHRDGRLVIFAGAGVSAARPSSIPTFRGIVTIIEGESGQRRRRPEPFDAFLGG